MVFGLEYYHYYYGLQSSDVGSGNRVAQEARERLVRGQTRNKEDLANECIQYTFRIFG